MKNSPFRRTARCIAIVVVCSATSVVFVSGVAAALRADPQQRIQGSASYSAEVHVATVAVTVSTSDGAPVTQLGVDDFEVFEDGRRQRLAFVLTPETAPLEVGILLDTSASIGEEVAHIRTQLAGLVQALDPRDCVLMLPFSDVVGPGFWNVDIERFVVDFAFTGFTRLNDAVIVGVRALTGGADELATIVGNAHCARAEGDSRTIRRAIVLITDGSDTASAANFGDALVVAWEARIPVIIMAVGEVDELSELADVTGGAVVAAGASGKQAQALERILTTLRSLYVIGFYLSAPPDSPVPVRRPLEVRLRRRDVRVVAPDAHYVSASRPAEAVDFVGDGRALLEAGDAALALDSFDQATSAYWGLPSAHYMRAVMAQRLGLPDLAERSARWAVFLDPVDAKARVLFEEIRASSSSDQAAESPLQSESIERIWIQPAEHSRLPLQYVATHVARMVAASVSSAFDAQIIARPFDLGVAPGLSVRIRGIQDDGSIDGEIVLLSREMEQLDRQRFELSEADAQIAAQDTPPAAAGELVGAIDRLMQRLRSAGRGGRP